MAQAFRNGSRTVHKLDIEPKPIRVAPWVYHKIDTIEPAALLALIDRVTSERPELVYNKTTEYEFAVNEFKYELEFSGIRQ